MQRMLALWISLMLMMTGVVAQEQAPQAKLQDLQRVSCFALVGDALYLLTEDALYRGSQDLQHAEEVYRLPKNAPVGPDNLLFDQLAASPTQLYAYHSGSGTLTAIAPAGGRLHAGEQHKLDLSGFERQEDHGWFRAPLRLEVLGQSAWLLMPGLEAGRTHLLSFSLQDGRRKAHELQGVVDIAPDKEGLLLLRADWQAGRGTQLGAGRLERLDPDTGDIRSVASLREPVSPDSRISIDHPGKMVYYSSAAGRVCKVAEGVEQLVAKLNNHESGDPAARFLKLPGRDLLLLNENGQLRTLQLSADAAHPLVVYGVSNRPQQHRAASMKNPALAVVASDLAYSQAALAQALLLEPEGLDVLVLQMDLFDLDRLIAKGWLLDLSGEEDLQRFTGQMHQELPAAGVRDGRLFALPVDLFLRSWFAHEGLIKKLGLELPTTFQSLCSLTQICLEHPELNVLPYQIMGGRSYREDLIFKGLQRYLQEQSALGELDQGFDTPRFRSMMQAADALTPGSGEAGIRRYLLRDQAQDYSLEGRTLELAAPETGMRPLLLSADEAAAPRAMASGVLIAINARSRQRDHALRYLRGFIEGLDAYSLLMMAPDPGHAIMKAGADAAREQDVQLLNTIERELAKSEGARRTELERMAQQLREQLAAQDAEGSYQISPAAILEYQRLLQHATLQGFEVNRLLTNPEVFSLYRRFAARQLDLERFIQEADGILRLIRLEDR